MLKPILLKVVVLILLSGCFSDTEIDVLNKGNKRWVKNLGLEYSHFCYDLDGLAYFLGDIYSPRFKKYKCVKSEGGSMWEELTGV